MKSHSDYERRFLQERSGFGTSYLLWFFLRYHAFGSGEFEGCVWLLLASLHQLPDETSKAEGSDEDSHCQPQDPGRRCHAGFAPRIFILGESAFAMWRRGAKPRTHAQGQHEADEAYQYAATTERTDGPQNTPSKAAASTKEPTLSDVMTTLQTMNSTMTSKLDGVSADVGLMREQFAELPGEVSALRLENDELKQSNYDMKTRLDELERKTDDLEGSSKRNNLIFYGLPRQEKETGANCEDMLRDLITDKLELADEIVFDRVHCLSSKTSSPVIARCAFIKDKVKILKAKRKLQGSNIFIGEDFCARVRDIRRKLTPHLKAKRNEGCRVSMVFDHLLVDEKRFTVDDYNNLTEIK